jgi:ABC-type Fe3+-siderophore transport system permease subunit
MDNLIMVCAAQSWSINSQDGISWWLPNTMSMDYNQKRYYIVVIIRILILYIYLFVLPIIDIINLHRITALNTGNKINWFC